MGSGRAGRWQPKVFDPILIVSQIVVMQYVGTLGRAVMVTMTGATMWEVVSLPVPIAVACSDEWFAIVSLSLVAIAIVNSPLSFFPAGGQQVYILLGNGILCAGL